VGGSLARAIVYPTRTNSPRLSSNRRSLVATQMHKYAEYRSHQEHCVREIEVIPGPKATAEDIRELARLGSASFGHAVGTCKMGMDDLAVVDPQLRVHGLTGLRVADASVMPQIITGPTNAPTHMIAVRAAKLILG
jgi:choline dehydrogenase-like flavoprotein